MIASLESARERLTGRDFDRIRKLAFDYCGLDIEVGKEELIASRIGKIMRGLQMTSFGAYFEYVMADRTKAALVTMIDGLTTNHTSFFREKQHFDFLTGTILPALRRRDLIELWSAACSTGEEPYSLAFALRDFFGDAGPSVSILATDISTRVLDIARNATYEAVRFDNVPTATLQRHLLRGKGGSTNLYRVKPEVRAMVQFERLNLMDPFHQVTSSYPVVLCRNVMIYFNRETQEGLVERLFEKIEPGGYLFIGHSESLNQISHRFQYVCPAVYRKPGVLSAVRRQKHGAA